MTTTLEIQGRIPLPRVAWPISPEQFDRLAREWRRSGLWLSMWSRDGHALIWDQDGSSLWNTLWSRKGAFAAQFSQYVHQCIEKAAATKLADPICFGDGPWPDDLGLAVAIIRWRRRILGAVVAGFVKSDLHGESFVRLCDQGGLDQSAMRTSAAKEPRITGDRITATTGLLQLTVEQARRLEVAVEEAGLLTQNLQNTYEELNLIYRISTQMGLPQKPQSLLEHVGLQVNEVSRAAATAFVLTETQSAGETRNVPGLLDIHSLSDRVVCVGDTKADPMALLRLAESLKLSPDETPSHVLLNDANTRPEFAWASDWLRHAVALPLWNHQKLMGVMLAVNCLDGGDFTSVDVQLFRAVADRIKSFMENQSLYDDLTDLLMGLLHSIVNSVDAKDPYTYGHSERVAFLSRALAKAAKLPPTDCERVYLAGLLHDVGKIGVPDAILCKPGKLTNEEFDALKRHPEIGVRILSPVRQTRDLMPGVLYHHERMDGRGYPDGLSGKSIPLLGRIICLADCFDAMTTNRTYRAALPLPVAISEVRRCAGTQFDPHLAELFVGLDLERLFREARACAGSDATISHIGALHAVLGTGEPSQVV